MREKASQAAVRLRAALIWGLFALIASLQVYQYRQEKNKAVAVFVFMLAAIVIHVILAKKETFQSVLIGNAVRDSSLDYLRLLAMLMVIITHIAQIGVSAGDVTDSTAIYIMQVLYGLTLSCNVVYVMLSGALLLGWKEESPVEFYLKRIPKILIPMFCYFLFYAWQNLRFREVSLSSLGAVVRIFFSGHTTDSPHYWLLFAIITIYITVPFLRYMLRDMPYKVYTLLCVLIVVFLAVKVVRSALGLSVSSSFIPFFADWVGVALLGYWVRMEQSRKYDRLLLVLAAAAFIFLCVTVKLTPKFTDICCQNSPVMILISLGFFVLAFRMKNRREGVIVRCLCKYNFGIILIHWWTINWITRKALGITLGQYYYLGTILSVIVTVIISFYVAFVMDNLVVLVPMTIWNRLFVERKK